MSPFSALGCWRTTTKSPSQIAASIIESPLTWSEKSVPWPTSSRGSGSTSSIDSSARIGPPAAMRPEQRHVGRGGPGQPGGGLLVGVDRGAHVHRARARRVAAQEALPLQLLELVGDRGRGDQADGLADLAHGRRVAVLLHPLPDDREDALLAAAQVGRLQVAGEALVAATARRGPAPAGAAGGRPGRDARSVGDMSDLRWMLQ